MKVIILNGSPRKNGATATVLHMIEEDLLKGNVDENDIKGKSEENVLKGEIREKLVKDDIEVEFINLSELKMAHCLGCCSCYKTGQCVINDDAELISQKIKEADGIVFGSPTYASNVSGLMKDLIDRGHFVIEQLLRGKYCLTVATGENYGAGDTLKALDKLVLYSGGILCGHLQIRTAFGDTQSIREHMAERIHKASFRMIKEMKRVNSQTHHPIQKIYHFVIFVAGIRPFVRKKGELYSGVLEKWRGLGI